MTKPGSLSSRAKSLSSRAKSLSSRAKSLSSRATSPSPRAQSPPLHLSLSMVLFTLATHDLPAQQPAAATEFAFEARVSVQTPLVVGQSSHGLRRVVPITGGTFDGPNIRGRVIPGGADWQFVRPDGVLAVDARYTLQTSDSVLILVT